VKSDSKMLMPREQAVALGRDTVKILDAGRYRAPSGQWVDLSASLARAVEGTVSYPPDVNVPLVSTSRHSTTITMENATTLEVGRRLSKATGVLALNFASATTPGGGFLSGARAQEESIARSSGLYRCLARNPMYSFHRELGDPAYTDYVIYSPDVPVFRTDDGVLLAEPWVLSIVTCPAVNASGLARQAPGRLPTIRSIMSARTRKVLSVACSHGHSHIVLGAWGCGAFGISGELMAEVFQEQLFGPFAGVFDTVVFAITDWSPEQRFLGPFRQRFRKS